MSEYAATALSDCQATRTVRGAEGALAREKGIASPIRFNGWEPVCVIRRRRRSRVPAMSRHLCCGTRNSMKVGELVKSDRVRNRSLMSDQECLVERCSQVYYRSEAFLGFLITGQRLFLDFIVDTMLAVQRVI